MADTDVDIANEALANIGEKKLISSLDEKSSSAAICKAMYDGARKSLLRMFAWPFATKRDELALVPYTRSGWTYAYGLPDDCIAPRLIYPGTRNPRADQRIPFAVELADDGESQILLTDEPNAELVYTANVSTVPLFDALFAEALGWFLAKKIVVPITGKQDLRRGVAAEFEMVFARATAGAVNAEQRDPPPQCDFLDRE